MQKLLQVAGERSVRFSPPDTRNVLKLGLIGALLAALIQMAVPALAQGQGSEQGNGRNFDARPADNANFSKAPRASQTAALDRLRQRHPNLRATFDDKTGATKTLWVAGGYLTDPGRGTPMKVATDWINANLDALGLDPEDVNDYEVTDTVYSQVTGATHIYLRQRTDGLAGYNCQLQINVNRNNRIVSVNNSFMPEFNRGRNSLRPTLSAEEAVERALEHAGLPLPAPATALTDPVGVSQAVLIDHAGIALEPIEARLMMLPVRHGNSRLVWNFLLQTSDEQHAYDFTVDARNGKVWTRFDQVVGDSYRVYAEPTESPSHGGRTLVVDPADATASPLDWHDTGSSSFTIMRGNNVHAYDDRDGNNSPPGGQPSCGTSLVCDFSLNLGLQPSGYTPAAIANLFYWNNHIHDIQYKYGFTEPAGNFQVNTFGRGGSGGDDVRAEAQDGGGTNNANFFTPTDGNRPRMQMYEWTQTNPRRDGDLDNGIITHEYGHGISIRQVGGPNNSSCLNNIQQMGEGWSDWWALAYTAETGDAGTDARGIGTYALGQSPNGSGIRTQRYSTNNSINDLVYSDIGSMAVPHGVGEVWAAAVWEVYWRLVNKHGFVEDLSNPSGAGNHRAMLYVNEGLKFTACSPTFTEARDGILQAAADNFNGEDVCDIWEAFAERGLGVNATSGGSNSRNATNSFDIPSSCGDDPPPPPPPSECPADALDFNTFGTESYSNQDVSANVQVADGGDTLVLTGNTWRRSLSSFNITPNTVVEFQFASSSQGEIHALGFDDNNTLNDDPRHFMFWGNQNWTGGGRITWTPQYSGAGSFQTFTIPVGDFYTGTMRMVFTNDKDSGTLNNEGRFKCVRVFEDGGGGGGPTTVFDDSFETGAPGWTKTSGSTDLWRLASDCVSAVDGSTTLSFSRASPNCDYDVGTAEGTVTSPVIDTSGFSSVTLDVLHFWNTENYAAGGFDEMVIQVSTNGGSSWSTIRSIDSATAEPSGFTTESFSVGSSTQFQVRFVFDSVDGQFNDFPGWYIDRVTVTGQ
ncbi:MAG TPA: M36 family metallopeptidase [Acidobacteriota bacterium]|nr:M36 family metallopeptidase [Acidobacteriota bacterium]